MNTKLVFSLVILASSAVIFGVHYQREQEKKFMRRGVMRELEQIKESNRLKKNKGDTS